MKRYLLIVLAILTVSCCPYRHIQTSQRDSVRVVTSVRTIERLMPDTVFIRVPDHSEHRTVRDTVSRLANDFAASCARINPDGSLYHDLRTNPRLWPAAVDRRETETIRTDTVYINRTRREVVEVPRALTWWQKTQIRGFWVLLAILAFLFKQKIVGAFRG